METPADYDNEHNLEFYCPACGTTSYCNVTPAPFLLAPGSDTFACPSCAQEWRIDVEYIPLDALERIPYGTED